MKNIMSYHDGLYPLYLKQDIFPWLCAPKSIATGSGCEKLLGVAKFHMTAESRTI